MALEEVVPRCAAEADVPDEGLRCAYLALGGRRFDSQYERGRLETATLRQGLEPLSGGAAQSLASRALVSVARRSASTISATTRPGVSASMGR